MLVLQLCLCVVTVIQLTSSQSTYDVIQQENDVSSCGRTEHVLSQLVTAVLQIQNTNSQLQRDIAELKATNEQKVVKGMTKDSCKSTSNLHYIIQSNSIT